MNALHYDIIVDKLVHGAKPYGSRSLDDIDEIIIHHSLTEVGSAEAFARYHVESNGWPGIGYHFVVDCSGIYKTNYLDTVSYHVAGRNANSVGICHVGNFDTTTPDDYVYLGYIKAVLIVDIILGRQLPVSYHRDYTKVKSCPGKLFDYQLFEKELAECREVLFG